MLKLHIQQSSGSARDVSLEDGALVVGRAPDCDLVLDDDVLSRRHLRFVTVGDRATVEDLGSSNGTLVNGELISTVTPVSAGDVVSVSGTEISIESVVEEPEEAGAPPPGVTVLKPIAELLPLGPAAEPDPGQADSLRHYADRLKFLIELHRALGESITVEDLLELVLDGAFEHLHPEEVIILLDGEAGLEIAAWRSVVEDATPGEVSKTLIAEVVERGQAALALDVQSDERFVGSKSMLASGARSLCAAPLVHDEAKLGMIALSSSLQAKVFSEEDLELLAAIASVTALRVRTLALAEDAAERERLESELAFARRLQVSLLPKQLPELAGFSMVARNTASRGVSGDYYQAASRGAECLLLVADVCGKGMGASLLAASLEATCSALIEAGVPDPDEILAGANRALFQRTPPDRFATAILAAVDQDSGRVRYVNAGHNPPLVLRVSGEVEELEATGFPLGMVPDGEHETAEFELAPGDLFVMFTDGIVEAENPEGEQFQLERFVSLLQETKGSIEEIADVVDEALTQFAAGTPFHDDRTLVMIRREPA